VSEPRSLPPGHSDPGHLLPEEDWREVVRQAERERERIERGDPPREAPDRQPSGRYGTGALLVNGSVVARSNGGRRPRGWPTFGVLHSAETPLRAGYAAAIARYFRDSAATSCHYMTDPAETWGVLPDELIAWHCGNGNLNSLALEQAGYASFTRAQWTGSDGMAQLHRNAAVMRATKVRYGIGTYWMSDQQLRDAHAARIVGGWVTHDQCRRVLGGTTHTDPMPNFPFDLQMQLANNTEDDDMFSDADRQMLMDVQRALGAKDAALSGRELPVQDTILHRMRDLTAAVGSMGAAQMAKDGKLPAGDTTLGIVRTLRDQLTELLDAAEQTVP
jgi:hypothetical protein